MARKRKETLYDRSLRVLQFTNRMNAGIGVSPDDVVEHLTEAAKIIDEMMHRRRLAAEALDIHQDLSIDSYIKEPGE
jgi:hypothetical protein